LKEGITVYITLYDFGFFVLVSIAVIVSAYLIAVLRQTFFLFSQVRGIIAAHDNDIRQTLSLLPVALANINLLSVSLTKTADQTSLAFRSLQADVIDTVDGLQDGLGTFIFYAKVVGEIFKYFFSKIA
jgi:hypothetical protein